VAPIEPSVWVAARRGGKGEKTRGEAGVRSKEKA
jgi:hypothetical protein